MSGPDRTDHTVRLVATDLDGTLLRADGTVSERTRRVVAEVEAVGVPVVMVTGRPLRWTEHLWPMVGDHGLAVLANGAVVYDVAGRTVRRLRGLEPDAGLALVERLRAAVPGVEVGVELLDGLRVEAGWAGRLPDDVTRGPLERLWDEPAAKLLVRRPGLDPLALVRGVVDAAGADAEVTWSEAGLVEVSAPGVTKAAALAEVCADLGVPASAVVAFGDMPNDVAMLGWAGTSYAVANAHPTVRDAADRVAPHHDEDGVARVLETLVLGRGPLPRVEPAADDLGRWDP